MKTHQQMKDEETARILAEAQARVDAEKIERKVDGVARHKAEQIARAKAPWTEQQERLLWIAQALLSDSATCEDAGRCTHKGSIIADTDLFAELKQIVQEISDDTAALIRAEAAGHKTAMIGLCDTTGCLRQREAARLHCTLHRGPSDK